MKTHVIIEGPDGSGKTTLAKRLCAEQGYEYHHEGPPPSHAVFEHYARLLVETSSPTVFDRLHLGELVYGPLLRGESKLTDYHVMLLNRLMLARGIRLVTCLPRWQTCLANNRAKEEFIKTEEQLREAYRRWAVTLFDTTTVNQQSYNYTTDRSFSLRERPQLPPTAVGCPWAKVLLIGEQANGSLDLPFFGTGASSMFLNTALADAGFGLFEVALVNALDANGRPNNLRAVSTTLGRDVKVVALGKVAEDLADKQRVPLAARLAHPQYWKRFHHHEREIYVEKLKVLRAA